jgi:uncharacterized protein YeaO (DUF488 family)
VRVGHASVYDTVDSAGEQGVRVLIMRYWPRGVKRDRIDVWIKDAAPSPQLLHDYTHGGQTWDEFERRYRAEILEERPHVLDELRALLEEHGAIQLLCHERMPPNEHCHRLILKDLLDSGG